MPRRRVRARVGDLSPTHRRGCGAAGAPVQVQQCGGHLRVGRRFRGDRREVEAVLNDNEIKAIAKVKIHS